MIFLKLMLVNCQAVRATKGAQTVTPQPYNADDLRIHDCVTLFSATPPTWTNARPAISGRFCNYIARKDRTSTVSVKGERNAADNRTACLTTPPGNNYGRLVLTVACTLWATTSSRLHPRKTLLQPRS
jgi:hypothetical protein